jgi:hypothetical protein
VAPEFHHFGYNLSSIGNDDIDLQTHSTENLDSILSSHPNSGIILTGDFNQFKHQRLCSFFSFKQIVNQATRGNNILDEVITNISKYYETPNVVAPLGSSDHNSVVLNPRPMRTPTRDPPVS